MIRRTLRRRAIALALTLALGASAGGAVLLDGVSSHDGGATLVAAGTAAPPPSARATTSSIPPTAPPASTSVAPEPATTEAVEPAPADDPPPSTTNDPGAVAPTPPGSEIPATPANPAIPTTDAPAAEPGPPTGSAGPAVEVVPGTGAGTPPATPPDDPIGELGDDRPVPGAFDLVAPPPHPVTPNGLGGPGGLAVAPSCAVQCITRGVAYPRGFGAELVVETSVPARLFMTVVADLDHNGDYEDLHVDSTPYAVTERTWDLDHLEPGETYFVMVAATDVHEHTAYAWGDFTTRSRRNVSIQFGDGTIVGGPDHVTSTSYHVGVDAEPTEVDPGQGGLAFPDAPRHVDLALWVVRSWDDEVCETWTPAATSAPHGHDAGACVAWSSTSLDALDLDQVPPGVSHWSQTSTVISLHSPTGDGGALPPGYGDPYWFSFDVPVTVHVTYTD